MPKKQQIFSFIIEKTHQFHSIKKPFRKSLTVPKNAKEGTLWAFLLPSWLEKIKITKEGTRGTELWRHQKFRKSLTMPEKE